MVLGKLKADLVVQGSDLAVAMEVEDLETK